MIEVVDFTQIPDGSFIIIRIAPDMCVDQETVEKLQAHVAEQGRPNCKILLLPQASVDGEQWGIWNGGETGGFMRDGNGHFYHYPDEQIAQAQANIWSREHGDQLRARSFREFNEWEAQRLADLNAGKPGTTVFPGEGARWN